jgi:hypothetical protein
MRVGVRRGHTCEKACSEITQIGFSKADQRARQGRKSPGFLEEDEQCRP